MYNVANYSYENVSESALAEIQSWSGEFDPDTLKSKDKAAYAFSIWVRALESLCILHLQHVPGVKAASAEAEQAAEVFNANKAAFEELSAEIV